MNIYPTGNYVINVHATGYQTTNQGAIVLNNQTATLNVDLLAGGGAIGGYVTDSLTQPIVGAFITVMQSNVIIQRSPTDTNGYYYIPSLSPGTYVVRVTSPAYQIQTKGAFIYDGQTTSENFTLSSNPGTVQGTILDDVSHTPVASASVDVLQNSFLMASTTSASDGSYSVTGLDLTSYAVRITQPGYQTGLAEATIVSPTPVTLDFLLSSNPGTVEGVVTSAATGTPIQGALVSLQQNTLEIVSTYTDMSGKYTFDNLPTGSSTIVVTASGYQNTTQGAYVISNQTLTDNFQLEQNPATVTGTITDATTSTPIAGAFIKIMQGSVAFASTMTDGLGRYSIPGMAPNTYNVRASCSGFQTNLQSTTLVAGQTNTVNFSLSSERGSVSGSIQDESHNPIPWTTVRALQNNNVITTTRTGVDGLYTLIGLAPGDFIIQATAADFQEALQPATVTDGHTLNTDFMLFLNPGKIRGIITDEYTGAVLPGITTIAMQNGNVLDTFFTDSNGFYTLVNLAPGQYTVVATGPSIYQIAVITVGVLAGENTLQNISLARNPGSVYGQVTDDVSHARLVGIQVAALSGSTTLATTHTDNSGMYSISGLAPGIYTIQASGASTYQYQIATQSAFVQSDLATEINFALQRSPGGLTGTVFDSSTKQPIPLAYITVLSNGTVIASASTNTQGVYTINDLPPGQYKVKASKGTIYTSSIKTAIIVAQQQTEVSFYLTPKPLPPKHLRGCVKRRTHGHNYRKYKYTIRWSPSCSPHVRGYHVYRDGKYLASILKKDELEYQDCHKHRKDHKYCVRTTNTFEELSTRVCITLE